VNKLKSYLAITLLALAGALTACAGHNPVKPALDTGRPELIAFALEGSYTIMQSSALEIARNPGTPQAVKDTFADIADRANPILDQARPLAEEAAQLRKQIEAGANAQERLAIVLAELNGLITRVTPLINELVEAIKNAGGGS
jgi:phage-related protein